MQCWSWIDVFCYFASATLLLSWHLSPLGILFVLLRFPFFVCIELPLGVLREFKITSFERRRPNRPYGSFFEYAALRYVTWVLNTFRASTCGPIFFGEIPARFLYFFRRCKYGTENIGDFEPMRATSSDSFNGYWVRSRSRMSREPDLVIYFVPGNLAGAASAYLYIEYLSMLLLELQVQGFANPVALVADIHLLSSGGYVAAFQETYDGWKYLTRTYPNATSLVKGSGVGGTLLLTLMLHLARPFQALEAQLNPGRTDKDETEITPEACSTGLPKLTEDELGYTNMIKAFDGANVIMNKSCPVNDEVVFDGTDHDRAPLNTTATISDLILDPIPVRKPDAMLLLSPFPVVWVDRFGQYEDLLGAHILRELRKQLVTPDQAYEAWARPGNVRDNEWWQAALPDCGTVVMYGSAEILSHDIEQLVQNMKTSGKLVYGTAAEDQLHAWPILLSLISRSVTDQMSGIDQVANHIANMLVMNCIC